jgi:hypothetical protein
VKTPTTVNLTQLGNEDDLKAEFRAIVAARKDGEVPVVFFDEFDRQLKGKELGWLELFLVPTWDGKFKDGASWPEFGKIIFVFAGGVAQTYEQFVDIVRAQSAGTKIADFLTRLTCKLDLPSLSYGDHEELFSNFTLIRRAIVLRSNIERFAPGLLQGGTTLHIDPGVAWGFLRVNNLKSGARSIEMLVNASNLAGKRWFGQSELPPANVLEMHVSVPEFWRRVYEGPDTNIDEPLLPFSGWPLRPTDRDFMEYTRTSAARLITYWMRIDHLRLRRPDGSELQLDDVEASGDARQTGAKIELTIPSLGVIRATVDRVNDQTRSSIIGDPNATGQLTVWATEEP